MTHELAIIGGSGFEGIAGSELLDRQAQETDYGLPSAEIDTYRSGRTTFHFLARHGRPHRIAPHRINYRANLRALYELGARRIIAINTVGGIAAEALAGTVLVPDQIIDYTYGREHTFCANDDIPLQHVDFTEPYSQSLRSPAIGGGDKRGV